MSWQEKTIADLGRIVTGKTPSTKNREFYDGEYLFVTPTDLDWHSYYVKTTQSTVTKLAKDKHKNQFIPADSTTFTCIGNTIGKCGITSQSCLTNQQINSIVPSDQHDARFVYYLMNYNRDKVRSIGLSGGAAQPIINKSTFSAVKVRVPDLPIQERIASILTAYDDLIENNRQRIALLEKSARLLYREWFVHFRFPGHETVNFVGGLPAGWRKIKVEDAVKRHPPGKLYSQKTVENTGLVPVLDQGQSGIIGYHNDEPSFQASWEDPVVVFSNHTCYQRIIHFPFSAIQNVLPFKPAQTVPNEIYWLHHATEGLVKLNAYKGHWPEFKAKEVVVPSDELAQNFGKRARPMHLQVNKLSQENEKLMTCPPQLPSL